MGRAFSCPGTAFSKRPQESRLSLGGAMELRRTGFTGIRLRRRSSLKFTRLNEPTQILTANRECNCIEANRLCRLPSGHPEGYFEAFGNLYRSFCEHLTAKKAGTLPASYTYPTIEDGIVGLKFIRACVESNQNDSVWTTL